MPKARPPAESDRPAALTATEAEFITRTVRRFFGDDAVIRNYGPDPKRLQLHVETSAEPGTQADECLGVLMCDIVRDYIGLEVTRPGRRVRGNAKIAYRQGEVLS